MAVEYEPAKQPRHVATDCAAVAVEYSPAPQLAHCVEVGKPRAVE